MFRFIKFLVCKIITLIILISCAIPIQGQGPIVVTNEGLLRGNIIEWRGSELYQFLGIPFAAPPIGSRRFLRPIPSEPWEGIRDATQYQSVCVQSSSSYQNISEDCLYLNVYVAGSVFNKRNECAKNVMFWIHGGSFMTGSGNDLGQYAAPMVLMEDTILVTINYRLGAFGWLYLGSDEPEILGNMGLWDQNLALHWTYDNIKFFGGNPNGITIFGESAGSRSVSAHILSPYSSGLFHNAIMESAAITFHKSLANVKFTSNLIVDAVDCSCENTLECLQTSGYQKLVQNPNIGSDLWPIFEGDFLPVELEQAFIQGRFNKVPIFMGVERDDGSFYISAIDPTFEKTWPSLNLTRGYELLGKIFQNVDVDYFSNIYFANFSNNTEPKDIRDALVRAAGDRTVICATFIFGGLFVNATQGSPSIYGYYHTQVANSADAKSDDTVYVYHTAEIPFMIGAPLLTPDEFSPEDIILSARMLNIWSTFAKTSKPPNQGSMEWPTFSSKRFPLMELNSQVIYRIEDEKAKFCIDQWPQLRKVDRSSW